MKQKLFVLNSTPQQLHDVRERLGNYYEIMVCHSLVEVQRNLEHYASGAVLPPVTTAHAVNGNGAPPPNGKSETADIDTVLHQIVASRDEQETVPRTLAARVDLLEQKIIESTLSRNRHHRKDTAAELGISRVTLYNKMKKFGMLN